MKTYLLVLLLAIFAGNCGCTGSTDKAEKAQEIQETEVSNSNTRGKAIANFAINSLFGSVTQSR